MTHRYTGAMGKHFEGNLPRAHEVQGTARLLVQQCIDHINHNGGWGQMSRQLALRDGTIVKAIVLKNIRGFEPIVRVEVFAPQEIGKETDFIDPDGGFLFFSLNGTTPNENVFVPYVDYLEPSEVWKTVTAYDSAPKGHTVSFKSGMVSWTGKDADGRECVVTWNHGMNTRYRLSLLDTVSGGAEQDIDGGYYSLNSGFPNLYMLGEEIKTEWNVVGAAAYNEKFVYVAHCDTNLPWYSSIGFNSERAAVQNQHALSATFFLVTRTKQPTGEYTYSEREIGSIKSGVRFANPWFFSPDGKRATTFVNIGPPSKPYTVSRIYKIGIVEDNEGNVDLVVSTTDKEYEDTNPYAPGTANFVLRGSRLIAADYDFDGGHLLVEVSSSTTTPYTWGEERDENQVTNTMWDGQVIIVAAKRVKEVSTQAASWWRVTINGDPLLELYGGFLPEGASITRRVIWEFDYTDPLNQKNKYYNEEDSSVSGFSTERSWILDMDARNKSIIYSHARESGSVLPLSYIGEYSWRIDIEASLSVQSIQTRNSKREDWIVVVTNGVERVRKPVAKGSGEVFGRILTLAAAFMLRPRFSGDPDYFEALTGFIGYTVGIFAEYTAYWRWEGAWPADCYPTFYHEAALAVRSEHDVVAVAHDYSNQGVITSPCWRHPREITRVVYVQNRAGGFNAEQQITSALADADQQITGTPIISLVTCI